jgi:predicted tellurium resistance membrane protein TerC
MDFLSDPNTWVSLVTLTVLEIVLGIDNMVLISIMTARLPAEQRRKARLVGLSLALFSRLALLFSINWISRMTEPFWAPYGHPLSGRDLVLMLGGLFLIYKSTSEIHERMEGDLADDEDGAPRRPAPRFWVAIAQIIVLDIVFSLDTVITAVGLSNEIRVMSAAIIIAVILMLFATNPLSEFINRHPTVVMLSLSFLLLIGFALVADGLGFHLPKGYIYAAMGFSVLVESLNQVAARRTARARKKRKAPRPE